MNLPKGQLVWWNYEQDHPISKSWDTPGRIVSLENGRMQILTFDDLKTHDVSQDNYSGTIRVANVDEVQLYLRRKASNLDVQKLELEQKARKLAEKIGQYREIEESLLAGIATPQA